MSFENAIRAAGLHPRDVVADGKIRRCATESKPGKRNGWYVLHPDGHGAWGDWTSGTGAALGTWKDESAATQAISPAVLERQRQQRECERTDRIKAMRSAREFWRRASPFVGLHPYLARKGLSPLGCSSLRVYLDKLVVPVWHGDWLISVQTITEDGEKRFWPGAPVKAGCFVMDRPRAAVTVFVEGLATGLAVFQSVHQARVVVCFDAGNLLPVVQRLQPTGSVCIGADNDHKTMAKRGMNPGIEKAANAADLIGCGVAYPEGIEGSDWADAMVQWGARAGKRIEREILAKAKYVMGVGGGP